MTTAQDMGQPVLKVSDLDISFRAPGGPVQAVDSFFLTLAKGETLCIVGESGCGKSVTSLAMMGLLPEAGRVTRGSVTFDGRELLGLKSRDVARIRGNRLSMIFQDPSSALNPVHTVGKQLSEVFMLHENMSRRQAERAAVEVLAAVGIPDPGKRMKAWPHELSGGMAQRVMIAMALACRPEVLIADEPTTALDVTIQAQILDLMRDLQRETGTAIILITHDLGVVAEMADRVAVMYAGQVVETAEVHALFAHPRHPYTRALMRSVPVIGRRAEMLEVIEGRVPPLDRKPAGCLFHPRCSLLKEVGDPRCATGMPPLTGQAGARCRCWQVDHAPQEVTA